ncbi:amidase [Zopfia rhizophila CBS 207.26]|uniref:Amidase n=1 Tax=Zopfia rhizophila CBS 207.26 TaxID=1314779 RepID=A0A6A6E6I2_9PEZI|nr:amidase [Zopfia rhizophila CBS 207.26]
MCSGILPLIQTKSVPTGDAAWEAKRKAILDDFISKVPEDYYIPQEYVDNPPLDVTDIPRKCGILTPEELEITENYDAVGLAPPSPYASTLPSRLQLPSASAQLLHTNIKEHMAIAGRTSSYGYVSTIEHTLDDAHMVSILRSLGAVFYVKTNQPQVLMHLESDSHLGRVLNPHNIHLSAGGSTGGEAALIALHGSVLGVGTDIGGSVRGPAGFCGIYGFKPTCYTLPMGGFLPHGFSAELNVLCSTGPMCGSLRDMDFFMRAVLGTGPHLTDPLVLPTPWAGLKTPLQAGQPLKIGIMTTDGAIQPQPPVSRALDWAASRLAPLAGVELKSYNPYNAAEAMTLIQQMYWPEGGLGVKRTPAAAGEPIHPLTQYIINDVESATKLTASDITRHRVQRNNFRAAFAQDWTSQDVDVVLCPVFVGPACAHDTAFYWNYTALWNFVDYPGAVFPTPIEAGKKGEEVYPKDVKEPLSGQCRHVRQLWEETDFVGAPIALQLVARKHYDNLLFGALEAIREVLGLS